MVDSAALPESSNAQPRWHRFWPLGTLLLAIFISSSAVVTPRQFIKAVVAYSPFPMTEEGFGRFWFNGWWLFVKGWHATEFGIVFLVVRHVLGSERRRWALLISAALAAGDEIHQIWVPRRGAHVSDWLIDMLGIAICYVIVDLRRFVTPWRPIAKFAACVAIGLAALSLLRVLALYPFP